MTVRGRAEGSRWILAAWLLLAGCTTRAPEPAGSRFDTLIAALASPAIADREAAADDLLRAGQEALPALRDAAACSDPEVAGRALEILLLLEAGHHPPYRVRAQARRGGRRERDTLVVEISTETGQVPDGRILRWDLKGLDATPAAPSTQHRQAFEADLPAGSTVAVAGTVALRVPRDVGHLRVPFGPKSFVLGAYVLRATAESTTTVTFGVTRGGRRLLSSSEHEEFVDRLVSTQTRVIGAVGRELRPREVRYVTTRWETDEHGTRKDLSIVVCLPAGTEGAGVTELVFGWAEAADHVLVPFELRSVPIVAP